MISISFEHLITILWIVVDICILLKVAWIKSEIETISTKLYRMDDHIEDLWYKEECEKELKT